MGKLQQSLSGSQLVFVSALLVGATAVAFYMGAKFGSGLFSRQASLGSQSSLLPDDALSDEMTRYLQEHAAELSYYETLIENKSQEVSQDEKIDVPDLNEEELAKKQNESSEDVPVVAEKTSEKVNEAPKELPKESVKEPVKEQAKQVAQVAPQETVAALIQKELQDEPVAEPEQVVSVAPKPAPGYQLIVGSFSDSKRATEAMGKWRERGFSPEIVTDEVKGKGKWYRIKLGTYQEKQVVNDLQQNIIKLYQTTPRIVAAGEGM